MSAPVKAFFAWKQNVAVAWYRMISFAKYMRRQKGVMVAHSYHPEYDSEVSPWWDDIGNQQVLAELDALVKNSDITVFSIVKNFHGLALVSAAEHAHKKPVCVEIDDYVHVLPQQNAAYDAFRPGSDLPWLVSEQLRRSAAAIVSTDELAKMYAPLNPHIHVVRNGIDPELWQGLTPATPPNERLRIGFDGSPNHVGDVRLIRDVLLDVLARHPNVELSFWGCEPEDFRGMNRVVFHEEWATVRRFPQALCDKRYDIALAPLKDNMFNRGKSHLRWMEHGALGQPVVASDMPAYRQAIRHGKTGFLCRTMREWRETLDALIASEELRRTVGENAKRDIFRNHSVADRARDYTHALRRIIRGYRYEPRRFESGGAPVGARPVGSAAQPLV